MRDNLKRVTIVLTKDQHQRYKEYSRKYHGSVSQFIRLAAETAINNDIERNDLQLRPIFEKLENLSNAIDRIDNILHDVQIDTSEVVETQGKKHSKIAREIEKLLNCSKRSLSIPEISRYIAYEQEDIISAMEHLENRFIVNRHEQMNSPSKWSLRGNCNE